MRVLNRRKPVRIGVDHEHASAGHPDCHARPERGTAPQNSVAIRHLLPIPPSGTRRGGRSGRQLGCGLRVAVEEVEAPLLARGWAAALIDEGCHAASYGRTCACIRNSRSPLRASRDFSKAAQASRTLGAHVSLIWRLRKRLCMLAVMRSCPGRKWICYRKPSASFGMNSASFNEALATTTEP